MTSGILEGLLQRFVLGDRPIKRRAKLQSIFPEPIAFATQLGRLALGDEHTAI